MKQTEIIKWSLRLLLSLVAVVLIYTSTFSGKLFLRGLEYKKLGRDKVFHITNQLIVAKYPFSVFSTFSRFIVNSNTNDPAGLAFIEQSQSAFYKSLRLNYSILYLDGFFLLVVLLYGLYGSLTVFYKTEHNRLKIFLKLVSSVLTSLLCLFLPLKLLNVYYLSNGQTVPYKGFFVLTIIWFLVSLFVLRRMKTIWLSEKRSVSLLESSKIPVSQIVMTVVLLFSISFSLYGIDSVLGISQSSKATQTYSYQVDADLLNVRSGPGPKYSVVGKLKKGDLINIEEFKGNWGLLVLEEKTTAWVYTKYVSKLR